jgi:four helix bundle protein
VIPFDRLKAGKAGYQLALAVYDATEAFPKREWYGLASQARRAAFSIPLNLAEGSAKRGVREYRRFVDIALGSLSELEIALRLAHDRQMLNDTQRDDLRRLCDDVGRLTYGLGRSLDARARRAPHSPSRRPAVQLPRRPAVQLPRHPAV